MLHSKALPAAIHGPTPIDGQNLAVDEPALPGVRQKENCPGNIVRRREATHRIATSDIFIRVIAAGLIDDIHFRFHPSGTDGVAADPAPTPLRR